MPSTLSLSCSKKLYELLGETYETEEAGHKWGNKADLSSAHNCKRRKCLPLPTFAETIRLLPMIGEKAGFPYSKGPEANLFIHYITAVAELYMSAPTEEEGMEQVSNYLEALL